MNYFTIGRKRSPQRDGPPTPEQVAEMSAAEVVAIAGASLPDRDTLPVTARMIIERAAAKLEIPAPEFVRRVRGEVRPRAGRETRARWRPA